MKQPLAATSATSAPDEPPEARAVLDFWFGPGDRSRDEWFRKDPAFDALIGERFGDLVERMLAGGSAEWSALPRAALARIVVLDQFPRNLFRDTPRAFAGDALALAAARALVAGGLDRALTPHQRWFAYLPFEHAEDRAAQQESLRLFGALAAEHPGMQDALLYARKHQEIIERFGRYPHRNAILGRPSSDEELTFLQQPGSRF